MDVARARLVSFAISFIFLAACAQQPQSGSKTFTETKAECQSTAVKNQYIVHWKDGSRTVEYANGDEAFRQNILEPNKADIRFAEQDQVVRLLKPSAESTIRSNSSSPPPVAEDWGQQKINAAAVWSLGYQGQGVVVAVVDSGTDVTHTQLKGQLAINTGEIAGNGIDDDKNGLIDDVNGYDFANKTGILKDGAGHGTHVSGIIAADSTAGPVQGVAPKAKLLPLRFMDDTGAGNISDAISALDYAISRKVNIVNASWGGAPCSQSLKSKLASLESHGILFVSAAGNDGVNLDVSPEYPAAYGVGNQLTIGASTSNDYLAGFSNTSYSLVNLVAPGAEIFSTFPGNSTKWLDGTSMASPFVAAAAAVLWSVRPAATLYQIRAALIKGVDVGDFPVASHGRLNLKKAMDALTAAVP
jgi:subtilisin family serine protease